MLGYAVESQMKNARAGQRDSVSGAFLIVIVGAALAAVLGVLIVNIVETKTGAQIPVIRELSN